ncbi:MAG: pyridoxal-phosphate dependent enzyme [Clostridia bacterium]|nr:pyridoxal-phosphate dependent enzyme [Clostridia bacterium]
MNIDIKSILKNATFAVGLDPDNRLASDSTQLSDQTSMLALTRYAAAHRLTGEIAAKFVKISALKNAPANEMLAIGASMLRDCYGKINWFVAPALSGGMLDPFTKVLKAYNPSIIVVAVSSTADANTDFFPAALPDDTDLSLIDEAVSVAEADALTACKDLQETESVAVGKAAGAALHAAKELALRICDRHARIVVLLPQE